MLIYDKDERWTATQLLKHVYFKEFRDLETAKISQFTSGPQGFARSISSNLADNLSQYSRRNSDNASDVDNGGSSGLGNISMNQIGNSSTYVTNKNQPNKKFHKLDKNKFKKQPKKFPELPKGQGDFRNSNQTMSSDDEVFNVSKVWSLGLTVFLFLVSTD